MIYKFIIEQKLTREIEMDAPSEAEAIQAVEDQLENGDIDMVGNDDTEIDTNYKIIN